MRLPHSRIAVRCTHSRGKKVYVLSPDPDEPVFVVKEGTVVIPLDEDEVVVDQEGEVIQPMGKFYRSVETIDPYHAVLDIWSD